MRSLTLFSIFFLSFSLGLIAQKNTIVTIDGRPISKEEFETIYKKNNTNLNDDSEVKTPQEYMKMFVDFKIKVVEAENQGLDTTQAFVSELSGYRDELAKTYLTDISITDSMVKEAYYRTVNYVKVSHILLELAEDATPEDTARVYHKLIEIRNSYLNNEKSFEELAREYSQDPSAATNGGSLPPFSAFKMITPFENAAFSTPVGQITMPVRTQVGMHLIRVENLIPSKGEVKVGHILLKFSSITDVSDEEVQSVYNRIDSLYQLLLNGAEWAKIALEYSDDKQAAKNDGIMKYISQEFPIAEFTDCAFSLEKDGDFSKPLRTNYGWHLIKRIETKPPATYNEIELELTKRVKADPLRAKYSKMKFIGDMKKEYGFVSNTKNIEQFKTHIQSSETDTLYTLPVACDKMVLFEFAGKTYTSNDYFDAIKSQFNLQYILKPKFIFGFDEYVDKVITDFENSRLEEKYPEFNYLIKEYHDGILLFTIMENEVWNKAIEDTVGLLNYYHQHKDKYPLGEHFDGLLIKCDSEETRTLVEKAIADGNTDADSLQALAREAGGNVNTVVRGRWEKGSNRHIDYLVWKGDKPRDFKDNRHFIKGEVKEGGIKTLDEARGMYISDYQSMIEKEWVDQLRKKYKITINESLLKKVKSIKN
jgi:peptidyl-prolyl cis-trans isomerase SurA